MHVHVRSEDGEAKYWLEPNIELAKNPRLKQFELRQIESTIKAHYDEFRQNLEKPLRKLRSPTSHPMGYGFLSRTKNFFTLRRIPLVQAGFSRRDFRGPRRVGGPFPLAQVRCRSQPRLDPQPRTVSAQIPLGPDQIMQANKYPSRIACPNSDMLDRLYSAPWDVVKESTKWPVANGFVSLWSRREPNIW